DPYSQAQLLGDSTAACQELAGIPKPPGQCLEAGKTDARRGFPNSRSVSLIQDLLCSEAGVANGDRPVVERHRKAHQRDGSFALVSSPPGIRDRLLKGDLLLVPVVLQPVNVGDAPPGFGQAQVVA